MTRIAIFSDLHVASNPELRVYDQWPVGNLRQAIAEVAEFAPTRLLVAGDSAYRMGLRENYVTLSGELDPLRHGSIEIDYLVGNHDIRENLRDTMGTPRSPVEGRRVAKWEFPHATCLLLDTQLGVHEVRGCIGVRQRAWIEQELKAAPETPFIVLGHHHPEDSRREDTFPEIGLRDTREWLEFLDAHSQIRAYLFGHTHSWRREQTAGGAWLVNLPATGFVFQKDRSCGWVGATLDETALRLEFHSLNPNHPEDGQVVDVDLKET